MLEAAAAQRAEDARKRHDFMQETKKVLHHCLPMWAQSSSSPLCSCKRPRRCCITAYQYGHSLSFYLCVHARDQEGAALLLDLPDTAFLFIFVYIPEAKGGLPYYLSNSTNLFVCLLRRPLRMLSSAKQAHTPSCPDAKAFSQGLHHLDSISRTDTDLGL